MTLFEITSELDIKWFSNMNYLFKLKSGTIFYHLSKMWTKVEKNWILKPKLLEI